MTQEELDRALTASSLLELGAEFYERANKKRGAQSGPLGYVALEVLRELERIAEETGELKASISVLMARTQRSKNAVYRGLGALRQHGFVDWARTPKIAGVAPLQGKRTNTYRLSIPPEAQRLLEPEDKQATTATPLMPP